MQLSSLSSSLARPLFKADERKAWAPFAQTARQNSVRFGAESLESLRNPQLKAAVAQSHEAFSKADSIVLFTHHFPDDDAIGSLISMREFLMRKYPGKRIDAVLPQGTTQFFRRVWGNGDTGLIIGENGQLPKGKLLEKYDVGVSLDCSRLDRLSPDCQPLYQNSGKTINIDHHTNTNYANINIVDEKSVSTSVILHREYYSAEPDPQLSPDILRGAFIGMMGDTMDLQSANAEALRVGADLLERGAQPIPDFLNLKRQYPTEAIQLIGKILADNMGRDGDVGYMMLPQAVLQKFPQIKDRPDDVMDAFFQAMNTLKSMEGLKFYFGLMERSNGMTLVSLRSKSDRMNACDVAKSLGGNGSPTQAAADLKGIEDFQALAKQVVASIRKHTQP